jgi:hypothetical protein
MTQADGSPDCPLQSDAGREAAYEPVVDPQAIRLMLTELMVRERPLKLTPAGGGAVPPLDDLRLRVSREGLTLTGPGSGDIVDAIPFADAILSTDLHGARLRFHAQSPRLIRDQDRWALQMGWPLRLLRLQERSAFRIRPSEPAHAMCVLRSGVGQERVHRVVDLSADGLALAWPDAMPRPEPDHVWQHCRLELPGQAPIPCDLRVRAIHEPRAGEAGGLRVGCEFDRPTPETQRAAQRYVIAAEREALSGRRPG